MSKTAFIFPGQASQFVGMGLDFYNKSPLASRFYDYAENIFDFSLKDISFYGPLDRLTETKVTQPAIFIHSLCVFEELKNRGYLPDMVAGHSLGEYSALVAAEVFSFETGLELVKLRAEQMQAACEKTEGTMAAIVGLEPQQIRETISKAGFAEQCTIANQNSPSQIVISGEKYAVQSVMMELKNAGAKRAIELTVGGAFHSPLMQEARDALKKGLDQTEFHPAKYPLYANVTGKPTVDPNQIKSYLYQQLTSPVLWVDSIQNMILEDATRFIELGPGKVLQGLIKRISADVSREGISSFEDLEAFEW